MNILFFHNNEIVPTSGGISRITDTLGRLFTFKGHKVFFLAAKRLNYNVPYTDNQLFLPSDNLFSSANIEYVNKLVKENQLDFIINQAALNPFSSRFLSECKKGNNFKIISCIHNSILTPAINAAFQKELKLRKSHLDFVFHIMKMNYVAKLITWLYIHKYRDRYLTMLNNCDALFVLNEGQRLEMMRMIGITDSRKIYVVPNCLDAVSSSLVAKDNVVLWIGMFDYSIKRPDYMLQIWKRIEDSHPNWELKMLGNGKSLDEMKFLAKKLRLKRVAFLGRVNPVNYYKKAKLSCVTSVHESFSLVAAESMMNGVVPVVFNSFTAASLLITNNHDGILVPAFEIEKFANELSRLMDNETKMNKMRIAGLESVKRFSLNEVYLIWQDIFHSLKTENFNELFDTRR